MLPTTHSTGDNKTVSLKHRAFLLNATPKSINYWHSFLVWKGKAKVSLPAYVDEIACMEIIQNPLPCMHQFSRYRLNTTASINSAQARLKIVIKLIIWWEIRVASSKQKSSRETIPEIIMTRIPRTINRTSFFFVLSTLIEFALLFFHTLRSCFYT